jgi:hypothetical protein
MTAAISAGPSRMSRGSTTPRPSRTARSIAASITSTASAPRSTCSPMSGSRTACPPRSPPRPRLSTAPDRRGRSSKPSTCSPASSTAPSPTSASAPPRQGGQALLRLRPARRAAHAHRAHARVPGQERHQSVCRLCPPDRPPTWAVCSTRSTSTASPKTRSSSSPPTTAAPPPPTFDRTARRRPQPQPHLPRPQGGSLRGRAPRAVPRALARAR